LLICIVVWSICAAGGAFVQSGWQLIIARAGVGFGEAALIPAAVSLLSDAVRPQRRGAALGVFSMGVHAGGGLALVLVGLLLPFAAMAAGWLQPFGITAEPWRVVLFSLLFPGLICVALLAAIPEPARTAPIRRSGKIIDIGTWMKGASVYLPHHLGMALVTLNGFALAAWVPSILIREHALTASQAGMLYGTVAAVVGVTCAYLGGRIGDWRSRAGGVGARLAVAIWAMPVSLAGFVLIGLANAVPMLMIGIAIAFSGIVVAIVVGLVSVSELAPADARGQITSIYLFFTGILGSALGPVIAGAANDRLGSAGISLSEIVAAIGVAGSLLACALLALARTLAHRAHRTAASPGQ
jgi:MFS family permease